MFFHAHITSGAGPDGGARYPSATVLTLIREARAVLRQRQARREAAATAADCRPATEVEGVAASCT